MKQRFVRIVFFLAFGTHAIATPIVVVATVDGFVIGTNGLDTSGVLVCKMHYAGSTAILRATSIARVPKSPNSTEMEYDSTVEEWKILDPKKGMSDLTLSTKQFFTDSTEHMADLLRVKPGWTPSKTEILSSSVQHIVVAGFNNEVPTLYAYSLTFANGSWVTFDEYPTASFKRSGMMWRGVNKHVYVQPFPVDLDLIQAQQVVTDNLNRMYALERTTDFSPPWEIVHVTKAGIVWLDPAHKDLCDNYQRKLTPK